MSVSTSLVRSSHILSSTGMRKAPVLPVPVWAMARRSFPSRAAGTALSCIGVASMKPISSSPSSRSGCNPMSSNRKWRTVYDAISPPAPNQLVAVKVCSSN